MGGRLTALGVLGGTFDPIHWGHLAIAEAARESLDLAKVLFVPAGQPPHKPDRPISPAADRAAMVSAAIADNPAFVLSTLELERSGPSWSADTLAAIAARERAAGRDTGLWFILSSEAARGLPSWHEPDRVLDASRIAVVPRAGSPDLDPLWPEATFPGRGDRFRLLDGPSIALSASEIRARAMAGRSIRYLVPPAVAAYIGDHALYRTTPWRTT
jgi:nicotinate-nucleotide adenylyltransferase